jgi:uncharacterized membrane protein
MNKSNLLLSAAVAGLLSVGFAAAASADDAAAPAAGKCYGIAKAGQNACANGSVHACKGLSKVDNDAGDFTLASTEDCTKAGGKTEAPAAK